MDVRNGNIVPALIDTIGDSGSGELWIRQPEKVQANAVTSRLEI